MACPTNPPVASRTEGLDEPKTLRAVELFLKLMFGFAHSTKKLDRRTKGEPAITGPHPLVLFKSTLLGCHGPRHPLTTLNMKSCTSNWLVSRSLRITSLHYPHCPYCGLPHATMTASILIWGRQQPRNAIAGTSTLRHCSFQIMPRAWFATVPHTPPVLPPNTTTS